MKQVKKKTCKCGYEGYFITKLCNKCREESKKEIKFDGLINKVVKYNFKPRKKTGELKIFKEIWNEREHVSQVSGKHLGEFNVCFFSHILNKGHYPRFRLDKRNIVLKTTKEHQSWETRRHELKELEEWKWVFELRDKLRLEDNKRNDN